jgi:hypothetical protein
MPYADILAVPRRSTLPGVAEQRHARSDSDLAGLKKGFIKSDFHLIQRPVLASHPFSELFSKTDKIIRANLRRFVNRTLLSTLVQYQPLVGGTAALSPIDELYASPGAICDFMRWLQLYAFDIIRSITNSEHHGFLEPTRPASCARTARTATSRRRSNCG